MVLDQSQLFGEPPLRLVTVRGACRVTLADQRPGEPQIAPDVVTLDLDEEPVAPEYRTAPLGEPARRPTPLRPQDRRKQPLPAAGQHDESRMSRLERREVEPRIAPVVPAKV